MISSSKHHFYSISSQKRNFFELDLGYKTIGFTFCQLLAFRKKVLDYSAPSKIQDVIENENFILMQVADNQHVIYLDVPQLLALKTLLLSVFKPKDVLALELA